ncbi:thiamine-phosphate diphosphorylase [Alcanivorax sp. S71-1-4]|uniref:Thiamine-phosphate synthase n=1 Tax=Isoalcanivorax pacificus W11-5 TaxID=391936 RepID=A0A0B4XIU5_9GAMM|nr:MULTISPECIES: thiamine phosphate synthase [Alcanivoracaceae]AJD46946.1 thiamine-phosphate pyrophosphorylase [Isoalcanivorax pacificus W11-5]KAF0805532.1 thiamine-phosphate diphosphorylase [Alcanivorax sp. S71-1-4]
MTPQRGLYAITDPHLLPGDRLLPACAEALAGGARLLQYRDKPADAATRLTRARALRALTRDHGALLIINDDPQLAADCGADGVHIGQGDGGIARARALLGADAIVGVTCHASLDMARQAQADGADYVAFGRFFPSRTKPQAPPADLAVLRAARAALTLPRVAIGGVNADNAPALIDAGADILAVIHALFGTTDIRAAARQLAELF